MLKSKNSVIQIGMITINIRGLDIEALLQFLSESDSTILARVWRSESRINAVYMREEVAGLLRSLVEQALVIVLDYDVDASACRLEAVATAGRTGLLGFPMGSPEYLESAFQRSMEQLAHDHGWQYEIVPFSQDYKGTKCPSCGAVYVYRSEKILSDGNARCQNCAKPFILTQK